jgi:nucleotide-binding universal stress UspA family protein
MFLRIFVPLDGSPLAEGAVGFAALLARQSKRARPVIEPTVILFRAIDLALWLEIDGEQARSRAAEGAVAYLEEQARQLRSEGLTVETAVRLGSPVEEILEQSMACQADLIVMTTHGRTGLARWALGSVAERVAREAAVPVLLIPGVALTLLAAPSDAAVTPVPRILVPLDGSARAEAALPAAIELASLLEAEVRLLYVFIPRFEEEPGIRGFRSWDSGRRRVHQMERYLTRKAEEVKQAGVQARWSLGYGMPGPKIIAEAQEHQVNLIVMTTQGREGLTRWRLGQVAEQVLRQGRLPILLAPMQAASLQERKAGLQQDSIVNT